MKQIKSSQCFPRLDKKTVRGKFSPKWPVTALIALFMAVAPAYGQYKLDHFKVYQVKEQRAEQVVMVQGQFDKEPKKIFVSGFLAFANPVAKDRGRIMNKNAHLTWYAFKQEKPDPKRAILLENQFGKQKIVIGQPRFLLVPTEKHERGSEFPSNLDHYVAYEVLDAKLIGKTVSLIDQFVRDEASVRSAKFFCVPVTKIHGKKVFKIRNGKDHLTVYDITQKPFSRNLKTTDQFGNHDVTVARSYQLCVPSWKLEVH
jgi:hypothetical protein